MDVGRATAARMHAKGLYAVPKDEEEEEEEEEFGRLTQRPEIPLHCLVFTACRCGHAGKTL
jgi:hypothetical protein